MRSLLEQLYDGEVFPAEQFYPKTEEYKKLHQEQLKRYTDFISQLKGLDPPLDSAFIRILDDEMDTTLIEMSEMFIDGFCLGARMMIEVYQKDLTGKEK